MAVLSFLFPIVGWITWGVKRNSDPEVASRCAFRWQNKIPAPAGAGLSGIF